MKIPFKIPVGRRPSAGPMKDRRAPRGGAKRADRECRQCREEYVPAGRFDDGFCSESCAIEFDNEIFGGEEC